MLNPRELRIGNLIYVKPYSFEPEIEYEVTDLSEEGTNLLARGDAEWYYRLSDMFPIPLTEEWLVRLGFSKNKFKNSIGEHWGLDVFIYDKYGLNIITSDEQIIFLSEIKYVHQLQNIYFALTGEELKLKQESK
jgi:hypothetical protein